MSMKKFKEGLSELYQGEATGEVVFYRLLERFSDATQQYKLGSLLQLETEAKARLRPAVAQLGLNLVELDESRDKGDEFDQTFEGMSWEAAMQRASGFDGRTRRVHSELRRARSIGRGRPVNQRCCQAVDIPAAQASLTSRSTV
jgi:hypothetical protein